MRTPSGKAKPAPSLRSVINATKKLWRQYHLTYDQTRYVSKEVRRALAIERTKIRQRVIARLSRDEEARLITHAYRMKGERGLLIKTLCQTGARVSEFVNMKTEDVFFEEQMILIAKAKGGKSRYVPILPELAQELRTHLGQRTVGYLFETNRATCYSPRRIQLSLSRLNHRLPRGHTNPEVVQGTAKFHHEIADALLPQADPIFDDATALHTTVDMLDP